jgi:N-acyl-D-aspartate/D-glutamate deacylase
MNYVASRRFDMDVGMLAPHSAVRVYVMGERGVHQAATDVEISHMSRLVGEAIKAGALGFGSSRLTEQRSSDGRNIPSLASEEAELTAIAKAMDANGGGVMQMAPEFNEIERGIAEVEMLVRVSKASNSPVMYSLKQNNNTPDIWRDLLAITARANAENVAIHPQVLGRPTGIVMSLDCSEHPFAKCPSYLAIAGLPLPARVAAMRQPALRETLLAESIEYGLKKRGGGMKNVYAFGEPVDYEPHPSQSLQARADRLGVRPELLAYDQLLNNNGTGLLLYAFGNYARGTLDPALEMMRFPSSVPGLGDGGAHSTIICDASISTFMLSYWTRDRVRGERMALPSVVKWLTQTAARAIGLNDRGLIRRGYKADLNVIDYDRLGLHSPRMVHDLPGGGKRLVQDARGYVATIVSGEIVRRDDQATEALPGRLVRGSWIQRQSRIAA